MRVGVALSLVVVVAAAAASAASAPATRRATVADDTAKGADAFHVLHEWWSIFAANPSNGDYLWVRLYDRPTPSGDVEVRAAGVARGEHLNPLQVQPNARGVRLAAVPDMGPSTQLSITRVGSRFVFDSTYGSARAHLVLTPSAPGTTAGPWRLPQVGVGGPPPTPVAGTFLWSAQMPAGTASGWVEVDGRRTEISRWRAFHDHVWGAFDRNWFHADFAVRFLPSGETWALMGLEPGAAPNDYRWNGSDARWSGVLVHGGKACVAHVVRSGWFQAHALGEKYSYPAPRTLKASCGGTTLAVSGARPGSDTFDGLFRTGGPTARGGWWLHTTPQFG